MTDTEQFMADVDAGLSSDPKKLPSRYFYDEIGDDLFIQIMALPEYYLTDAEMEIFSAKTYELIKGLGLDKDVDFDLIELGPGDGTKTRELLKVLMEDGYTFTYRPIDISAGALDILIRNLRSEIKGLQVKKHRGDYFRELHTMSSSDKPKVVLFLGSNIGNMYDEAAHTFIEQLSGELNSGDQLVLGVDLKKPRSIVLPAYNDSQGVTAMFNLNLLARINRELGGNFDTDQFMHTPEYDEGEGIARSYLTSTTDQKVRIKSLNKTFQFAKGERILMEVSRKYDDRVVRKLIAETELSISGRLTDKRNYFCDYILVHN